jgi:hypothetical protein
MQTAELSHATSALGYAIWQLWPIDIEDDGVGGQFSV